MLTCLFLCVCVFLLLFHFPEADSTDQLWSLLYDRLANKGISLVVVVDCLELIAVSDILVKNKVISTAECRSMRRSLVNGCSSLEVNRHLVDKVARKKASVKRKFCELLAEHQPQLWHLSQQVWCARERKMCVSKECSLSQVYGNTF